MDKPLPGKWRYNIIFGLLGLLCACLAGQLAADIHFGQKDCQQLARTQERILITVPARAGNIWLRTRDRYVVAATSDQVPSCYADPNMIPDAELADFSSDVGQALNMDPAEVQAAILSKRDITYRCLKAKITPAELEAIENLNLPRPTKLEDKDLPEVSRKLAGVLGMEAAAVLKKLTESREPRFAWLKRGLTEQETGALGKLKKEKHIRSVGLLYESKRHYPNAELAAPVMGFCLKDGSPAEGLEAMMRRELMAQPGKRENAADAGRRSVMPLLDGTVLPKDGNQVFLTIDACIQGELEQAVGAALSKYKGKWGVGVVMDPQTGEILAMCSLPTFNPNKFNEVASPEDRKNRCLVDPYEPGSAFKCLMAAAAVDSDIGINWQSKFYCEGGSYNAPNGGHISDHGQSYGWLTLEDIIVHSSNIGMAKVGERLGNSRQYDIVHRYGFGQYAHIQMPVSRHWPGESAGIVRYPLRAWDGYSMRRVPFGQEISVTALQLTNAYCALANGGELLEPRLVDSVVDPTGKLVWQSQRKAIRRVIKPSTSQSVLAVMEQVVERGTGKACKLDLWSCGGKTGTAQIAVDGVYVDRAFTSSFIGVAPVTNPRLVCLVSIYWPRTTEHYGAQVAAPAVKQVLEKSLSYLNVPSDKVRDEVASSR